MVTPMKWEGVDEKLAKMVSEANLDHASERRRIREIFKDIQLSIDHCLFKVFNFISVSFENEVSTDVFVLIVNLRIEKGSVFWV